MRRERKKEKSDYKKKLGEKWKKRKIIRKKRNEIKQETRISEKSF